MQQHKKEAAAQPEPPIPESEAPSPVNDWAEKITTAWQKSVENIFEVGRLLIAAKTSLPHGAWEKMVDQDLPFGIRTVEMLMRIGKAEYLAKHASLLPPSWYTLYELTLMPEVDIDTLVEAGKITPALRRSDVEQLRREQEVTIGAEQPDETPSAVGPNSTRSRSKTEPTEIWKQKPVRKICDALKEVNEEQLQYLWHDVFPRYPSPKPSPADASAKP